MTTPSLRHSGVAAQPTLQRSLHAVRVVLSLALLGLMLSGEGGSVAFTGFAAAALASLAVLNAVANGALFARPRPSGPARRLALTQLLVDALLATAGMLVLDARATPLAWVMLLLPIFDAGLAFGAFAAGITWGALSLVYVGLRLQVAADSESDLELLRLAVQQLAAVAAVALPIGYIATRLRDDLERAHEARVVADRRSGELLLIAATARELSRTLDRDQVLDVAVRCAAALGFERVEACERPAGRRFRVLRAIGSSPTPPPEADPRLDEAVMSGALVTAGVEPDRGDVQELHLYGFRACAVVPLVEHEGRAYALRAWSVEELAPGATSLQSLALLASVTTGAWHNAATFANLESWSQQLEHEATHDPLTGLANRAHLRALVEQALVRLGDGGPRFAVLFLDLDGFKDVNDQHGHDAGDAVLQAVAKRLQRQLREYDTIARLGGDEFVVLLASVDTSQGAEVVAARICDALAAPYGVGSVRVNLGVSVGVAHAAPGETVDDLLTAADSVMYEAKKRGGSGFAVHRVPAG